MCRTNILGLGIANPAYVLDRNWHPGRKRVGYFGVEIDIVATGIE